MFLVSLQNKSLWRKLVDIKVSIDNNKSYRDNHVNRLQKVNIYQDRTLILKDIDFQAGKQGFIISSVVLVRAEFAVKDYLWQEWVLIAKMLRRLSFSVRQCLISSAVGSPQKQMGIIFQDSNSCADRSVAKNLKFVLQATGWTVARRLTVALREVLAQSGYGRQEEQDAKQNSLVAGTTTCRIAHYFAEQSKDYHCR